MQKLDFRIIDRLIGYNKTRNLTNKELDLLLYLSRYQEETGIVRGVYYKNVCAEMKMSVQSFYLAKASLENKGIIKSVKVHYADFDITICDNDWSEKSYRESYINTNHEIFYSSDFLKLSAGEKLFAIILLRINLVNKGSFRIGVKNLYRTYCARLGVVKRVLQRYLANLKSLFAIGIKEGMYYITIYKTPAARCHDAESSKLHRYVLDMACRRCKIEESVDSRKEYNDILHLFEQYSLWIKDTMKSHRFDFTAIIQRSLTIINDKIKNKYRWQRRLKASLVHRCLKQFLKEEDIMQEVLGF